MDNVKTLVKHIQHAKDRYAEKFSPTLKNITLTDYQQLAASVFLLEDYRQLLLYWETGFGKTIFCTYVISNLFKIYPQWKIFLLVKSSLKKDPWEKEFDKYLIPGVRQHINFVHYDIIGAKDLLILKLKTLNKLDRVLFVFDESHDFIKKLIPKEDNMFGRNLTSIVNPIIEQIYKGKNKILFMSATPIVDSYKELLYTLNFLRHGAISLNQPIFSFGKDLTDPRALSKICLGICSFQRRSELDVFKNVLPSEEIAGKKVIIHNIYMSDEQTELYKSASKIELSSRARGFRMLRRLVNTFAFKELKFKDIEGDEDYERQMKNRQSEFDRSMQSIKFSDAFLNNFKESSLTINRDSSLTYNLNITVEQKVSLNSSLRSCIKKPNVEISNLFFLNSLSSKYVKTCQLIKQSRGKCLVYQPFVTFEGVRTLLIYLEKFDISYVEYTQNTRTTRSDLVRQFNEKENNMGDKIKCCVLSGAGSEGISMTCVSDMIIMDIPWSGSHLEQLIGRGIRLKSHNDLPLEERYVNIHILVNHTSGTPSYSVDKEILDLLTRKENQKVALAKILRDSSIEYSLIRYPDIEPIDEVDLLPIVSQKYNTDNEHDHVVSILRKMVLILISFDVNYGYIEEVYLDSDTEKIYINTECIGTLRINENGQRIFKIINNQIVYFAKAN